MGMLFTVLSIALVVAALGVVGFVVLVEPFVGHTERFRDLAAEGWARARALIKWRENIEAGCDQSLDGKLVAGLISD